MCLKEEAVTTTMRGVKKTESSRKHQRKPPRL